MGKWCYGFVERKMGLGPDEEYSELLLCEIYFNDKGELNFYTTVDWEDVQKDDKKYILKDLKSQLNNNSYWFKDEDFPNEE